MLGSLDNKLGLWNVVYCYYVLVVKFIKDVCVVVIIVRSICRFLLLPYCLQVFFPFRDFGFISRRSFCR